MIEWCKDSEKNEKPAVCRMQNRDKSRSFTKEDRHGKFWPPPHVII